MPQITIPWNGFAELRFDTLVSNEQANGYDTETIEYSFDGNQWETLLDPMSFYEQAQLGVWQKLSVPLPKDESSPDAPTHLMIRFVYDTVDDCCGPTDVVGWYLDNIIIEGATNFTCDDNDACTSDWCDPADSCMHQDTSAECDDGDPCTGTETCDPSTGCESPFPFFVFTDLEAGLDDGFWSTGSLDEEMLPPVMTWQNNLHTGGSNPAPFTGTTIGTPNAGGTLGIEHSYMVSELIVVEEMGALGGDTVFAFDSFVSHAGYPHDNTSFEISYDGGMQWEVLISADDGAWGNQGEWTHMEATVAVPQGGGFHVRWVYESTGSGTPPEDVQGWFIDNIALHSAEKLDCDDDNPCTADLCEGGDGCVHITMAPCAVQGGVHLKSTPDPEVVFDVIEQTYFYKDNRSNSIWHAPSGMLVTGYYEGGSFWTHGVGTDDYPTAPNNNENGAGYARIVHLPSKGLLVHTNSGTQATPYKEIYVSTIDDQGQIGTSVQADFQDGFTGDCNLISASAEAFLCWSDNLDIRIYNVNASGAMTIDKIIDVAWPDVGSGKCNNNCFGGTFAFDGVYFYFALKGKIPSDTADYIVIDEGGQYVGTFTAAGDPNITGVYFDWSSGRYVTHDGYGSRHGGQLFTWIDGSYSDDSQCYGPLSAYHGY